MLNIKQIFILLLISINCYGAAPVSPTPPTVDQTAITLITSVKKLPLEQRLLQLSAALLNKPYQNEPLGEGASGKFNQEPLYRFDCFDCTTYVNTILALSLAQNLVDFQTKLQKIVYLHGKISFFKRTHFVDADWLPNNLANGYLKPINQQVAGKNNIATTQLLLNRKNWYQHLTIDRIKIPDLTPAQQAVKLQMLHAHGNQEKNIMSSVTYIPIDKLFPHSNNSNNINYSLFAKIPNGTIILFVQHDPDTAKEIGTSINITHMGLVVWQNDKPYLRAASSLKGKTVDLPLIDYVQYYSSDPRIKGISLYQIHSVKRLNS